MVARERVARASISTVSGLFLSQVRQHPERIALEDWGSSKAGPPVPLRRFSYRQLEQRMLRLAGALAARGVSRGDRVALLSENRAEYLEVFLAAGCLGASVACQNWRLSATELAHCLRLVEPRLFFDSPRHAERLHADAPRACRRAPC
jgi:acyl-CoA synthetase (AMP-forming)/AMP-acid ligase II